MPGCFASDAVSSTYPPCPHCPNATRVVRNGHSHGKRRYKCTSCGVTFASDTANQIAAKQAKKARFKLLANFPTPLRSIADLIGVSVTTAFRWRHDFLTQLRTQQAGQSLLFHDKVLISPIRIYSSRPTLDSKHPSIARFSPPYKQLPKTVCCLVHLIGNTDHGKKQETRLMIGSPNRVNLGHVIAKRLTIGTTAYTPIGRCTVAISQHAPNDNREAIVKWRSTQPTRDRCGAECCIDEIWSRVEEAREYRLKLLRWMSTFRGISINYISRYVAWFNFCTRRPHMAVNVT